MYYLELVLVDVSTSYMFVSQGMCVCKMLIRKMCTVLWCV